MRRTIFFLVLIAVVLTVTLWSVGRFDRQRGLTLDEVNQRAKKLKSDMKAELAARGEAYEPGAFPSAWGYNQRVYPYDRINFEQVREAVAQAQAFRLEARKAPLLFGSDWVEEGPNNIGARVTDLAMHPTDPDIIYAAHASSGIFRTVDGGASWHAITDDLPVITMGAMAVDPENPDIIYAGTGEANAISFSFFGTGLYKSVDAGASWQYAGLESTCYIARIVIDPLDTERIWVAGTGELFGTNPERGVYRSLDGGGSWARVLFVSDSTAATDIVIDPARPDTVFAAMWERTRGLTYRKSGGETSGIYRSYDGGDTWTELSSGLPSGPTEGRIGLSLCAASPNVIYAQYDNPTNYTAMVYKSTDGGDSWARTNDGDIDHIHSNFGWYFGQIRVDPECPDTVFAMGVEFYRSTDGGNSWDEVGHSNHVDHHAMAFDPNDHTRIFEGNDGGVYVTTNSGDSWSKLYDQHTNQFYAIEIDYLEPSRLYGGTQDNGTLRTATGMTDDWERILGGDGFYTIVDPTNSDIIYAEYQYGNLYKSTDFADSWDGATGGIDEDDRFNWMMPVVMHPLDHLTLYCGTHRVYKTVDGADEWSAISGDLTNGDQGAGFGTITTVAVTPADPDVIYVGTDDSNVWVTQNGGDSWTNISGALPNRWVTRVAVDPEYAGTAYVTFSGLRWNEDIGYVYRTTDYGTNWTDITENLPGAPVNAIVIDPDKTDRLFVGSDVGCYYTESPGTAWEMLGTGLPAVSVFDLKIHNPSRVLVAGTHGRSMLSFDLTMLPGPGFGISRVADHPEDQGGAVDIRWYRIDYDFAGSDTVVDYYSIWRRADGSPATGGRSPEGHLMDGFGDPAGTWECIDSIPASEQYAYALTCSTTCDSTEATGLCWSVFYVKAHCSDPVLELDTEPDSGYSFVNIWPKAWTDVTVGPLGHTGPGSGLTWVDYDDDGDLDIYFTNRVTSADVLLRNDSLAAGGFVDATPTPLAGASNSRGCPWGDYDGDGDEDVYVSVKGANRLVRNDGGGVFVDVTAPPLDDGGTGQTAAWFDYDNDGDLDLYIVNNGPNKLFRNDGGGTFTDATAGPLGDERWAMGLGLADYDDDGDMDIYVANYGGASNVFLENQGGGVFADATTPLIECPLSSYGATWFDYDNDGDLDLYVTNEGANRLFRNDGGGFTDATYPPLDDDGLGRSAAWGDFDNDGDLDLYVVNDGTNRTFRNLGGGVFEVVGDSYNALGDVRAGFGSAFADYDEDGDLDLYLVNDGANCLFRNELDSGAHWLEVDPVGVISNTDGVGARVRVVAGGTSQIREIAGATGFASQGPLTAWFGLGNESVVDTVEVTWPASGSVQVATGIACDQTLEVVEDVSGGISDEGKVPHAFRLYANQPNPFTAETVIRYDLAEGSQVGLAIFDVSGRSVCTLLDGQYKDPGRHTVHWDGRNSEGKRAAPGMYFCRLTAGSHTRTQCLVLLK